MDYYNDLHNKCIALWYEMPISYKSIDVRYSRKKDKALLNLNKSILKYLQNPSNLSVSSKDANPMLSDIKKFALESLGMSQNAVDSIFKTEFYEPSKVFIQRAKALVPEITQENLFQALRNVWVMHTMQLYLNKPVCLTDAMFAYSMLYPLTDNYLDNPNVSKEAKFNFNGRFRNKILTGNGEGKDRDESRIFHMIDLIEGDWSREAYPDVFRSLAGILDGQNNSLYQHDLACLYHKDILSITFYKGGTSVLADAYLVAGSLSEADAMFAFLYGVILQLCDDIQDIDDDLKAGHYTLMNLQTKVGTLDGMIYKLLNYMDYFLDHHYAQDTNAQQALKELTSESVQLLIFEAIMKSKHYVSKGLLKTMKKGSHFSSRTYKRVENSMNRHLNLIGDVV